MKLYTKKTPGSEDTWFAWYPVETTTGEVVWLETVKRDCRMTIGGWGKWEYSRLNN